MTGRKEMTLSPITIFQCLLLWLPFLLLLPFIFLLLFPLALYKGTVITLWKLLKRHDLITPVTGLDVMFSTDDYHKQPLGSLGFVWFLEGPISPKIIRKRLKAALLSAPAPYSGNLSSVEGYEKLTSVYPTFWLGFPFWKRIPSKLNIADHVKIMRPKDDSGTRHLPKFIVNSNDINRLICGWMSEPFSEGRPLWEIRLVEEITFLQDAAADLSDRELDLEDASPTSPLKIHGVNASKAHQVDDDDNDHAPAKSTIEQPNGKVKSILILKTHHMLGDGNSMLRLLDKIIDSPPGPPTTSTPDSSCNKAESTQEKVENNRESLGESLPQRDETKQAIKTEEKLRHQEEKHTISHSNGKSPNFTTTYIPSNGNAADAIKAEDRKELVDESTCYLRWWRWLKVIMELLWCQLSNTVYFVFFIPSSLFSLINTFVLHKDRWFTKKKESVRMNWATESVPMARLNEIRRKFCSPASSPNLQKYSRYCDGNERKAVNEKRRPMSIIVMAVAALAGALQRQLIGNNMESEKTNMNGSRPRSSYLGHRREQTFANFIIALPLRKEHPGRVKFCNFWTHGILKVDFPEWNSQLRLQKLNSFYSEMRAEQRPEIYHSFQKLFSLLPKPFLSFLSNYNMGASIGVTNMADSREPVFIGGHQVCRKFAYFGLQWRHASLTLALLSYNGEMTATILANESVIREGESVEKLLKRDFHSELELFGASNTSSPTGMHQAEGAISG